MPETRRVAEPTAVILATDVLSWTIGAVAKFPRNLRFGLGSRIESALTDVLEGLVTAQYARDGVRARALELANRRLQVGRHLARIAVGQHALSERQGVHLNGKLLELGAQIGGWRKASERTVSSSRA